MKFRHQTYEAKVDCPVEDCDRELLVQILMKPDGDDLVIDSWMPELDLHLVEHGMEPVIEEETRE